MLHYRQDAVTSTESTGPYDVKQLKTLTNLVDNVECSFVFFCFENLVIYSGLNVPSSVRRKRFRVSSMACR
jgi:hypothetical protein